MQVLAKRRWSKDKHISERLLLRSRCHDCLPRVQRSLLDERGRQKLRSVRTLILVLDEASLEEGPAFVAECNLGLCGLHSSTACFHWVVLQDLVVDGLNVFDVSV